MIDRGVQIERTRLAWKRTLLATGVLCCAAIRALSYLDSRWGVACACGVVLFAAECVVYWLRRSRYESWFLAVDRRGWHKMRRGAVAFRQRELVNMREGVVEPSLP